MVVGGVLLVVGLSMAGLWWLLAVVAVELAGIAIWGLVALIGYLRGRLVTRRSS